MGGGQNEINARHLQTEVGVEVEDELGKKNKSESLYWTERKQSFCKL